MNPRRDAMRTLVKQGCMILALVWISASASAAVVTASTYWPANPYPPHFSGYNNYTANLPAFGSITGATLPGGLTIQAAYQYDANFTQGYQVLVISGFSS